MVKIGDMVTLKLVTKILESTDVNLSTPHIKLQQQSSRVFEEFMESTHRNTQEIYPQKKKKSVRLNQTFIENETFPASIRRIFSNQ